MTHCSNCAIGARCSQMRLLLLRMVMVLIVMMVMVMMMIYSIIGSYIQNEMEREQEKYLKIRSIDFTMAFFLFFVSMCV